LNVQRAVHTAEHLASAMFWLGVERAEIPRAKLIARDPQPQRPLAVIHAVAATPQKTWRAEGFLAVAEHLQATGTEPVFIGANAGELAPFVHAFRTVAGASLEQVKSLLSSASLFIGMIPARRTWRQRSDCPWWSSSAPPIPPSGDPGAPQRKCSPRRRGSVPSPPARY
jgi:hypothetical protein